MTACEGELKLLSEFFFNADDMAFSEAMSKDLIEQIRSKKINSVSVLANGKAFESSRENLNHVAKISDARIAIHLNLTDGFSSSPPSQIPLLTHKDGTFKNGFLGLLLKTVFASTAKRDEYKRQILIELTHQIAQHLKAFPKNLCVDGHNHIHMVPVVFSTLLSVHAETPIFSCRIPRETFLRSYLKVRFIKPINVVKYLILNFLITTGKYRQKLLDKKIRFNRFFFGVLFSGKISSEELHIFCEFASKNHSPNEFSEVCVHPGAASKEELGSEGYKSFFCSPDRLFEKRALEKFWENY